MNECVCLRDGKCMALRETKCENCGFRKTREERDAGRKKAMERIESLPPDLYAHIRMKYYLKPLKFDEE